MTRQTRNPRSRPVMARRCPIGHARTKQAALRLAYRFAGAVDRDLLSAGWRLACREIGPRFHVTLAK